ncbi:MAG: ThuA domain-containing protein [Pirellulaceae bacterium]
MVRIFRQWFWLFVWSSLACAATAADLPHLKILFLGDNGHHQPAARYQDLAPALARTRIELRYTDDVNQLSLDRTDQFDGLVVYANIDEISPEQADALLAYVNSGKGFIPLHCAAYCFRNSDQVVALMGGQFKRHGTGVFSTALANEDHPIMQGFGGFP